MYYVLDPIIEKIVSVVDSHKIASGNYARWMWQNKDGSRELGSNPYGCADAANILYTLGKFPSDLEERAAFVKVLQDFQDEETGLYKERTHHTYHTTAHCTAALELFDAFPKHPFRALEFLDEKEGLIKFLDSMEWERDPWSGSHQGAGVFASKIICEKPSIDWQNAYFDYLTENCDKTYGFGVEGATGSGARPVSHYLNGWFHYLFNFNHCHRDFPRPTTLVDTLIELYKLENVDKVTPEKPSGFKDISKEFGFRGIDWVFALNRASAQTGYRREDAKEMLRHFAKELISYIEEADENTHEIMNDLHMLFGTVCCLSELCLALPGELVATVPLKNVLDRRPFI